MPANGPKMSGIQHIKSVRGKLEVGENFSVSPLCCHFKKAVLYPLTFSICQTTRAIAATQAQCEHKSRIEKLGISVVNQ